MLNLENRYQFQNRWVKFGRWLRYRPVTIVKFVWWFLYQWCLSGCPGFKFHEEIDTMTRWETLDFMWSIYKSDAHYKMQWYFTGDEVLGDMRARSKEYYTKAATE